MRKCAGHSSMREVEYVIVRALQFHRDGGSAKHVSDIRSMLEASSEIIDRSAVETWARGLRVEEHWHGLSG